MHNKIQLVTHIITRQRPSRGVTSAYIEHHIPSRGLTGQLHDFHQSDASLWDCGTFQDCG